MVWFGILATGCQEVTIREVVEVQEQPFGRISILPESLVFGTLTGEELQTETIEVRNIGDGGLTIDGMGITDEKGSFFLSSNQDSFVLGPGASRTVHVVFQPRLPAEQIGILEILSSDDEQSVTSVPLTGYGAVPQVYIEPDLLEFGSIHTECDFSEEWWVWNIGVADLEITSMGFVGDQGLTWESNQTYPFTLHPNTATPVTIHYAPEEDLMVTGILQVESNDPNGLKQAVVSGIGAEPQWRIETFSTSLWTAVDIIFLVDQSGSMNSEAQELGEAFSEFVDTISGYTPGWEIGLVTQDSGCFNYGILTQEMPNLLELFINGVNYGNDDSIEDDEALFRLAGRALEETSPTGCNAGFLDEDAPLHLIFVSDEMEQSGTDWSVWVETYEDLLASPDLLQISSIVDVDMACGDGSGGTGYIEAANYTDGLILDICDSHWADEVADLARASLPDQQAHQLPTAADPDTIAIYIDNLPIDTIWVYNDEDQTIYFGGVLAPETEVVVSYRDAIDCSI